MSAAPRRLGVLAPALPAGVRGPLDAVLRRLSGRSEEDAWGRDPDAVAALAPLLDGLYERWWRVRTEGLEHLPRRGPALVVANHAGMGPWDALMLTRAIARGAPPGREARVLVGHRAFELPFVSIAARRLGGVPASAENARRLLEEGHVVLLLPESLETGPARPWADRYRVGRLGRGGILETAWRSGVPIVPCAVVGSEETYPVLASLRIPVRLLGAGSLPLTPTFPWLGPLGLVPLPSCWRIEFGAPVVLDEDRSSGAPRRPSALEAADVVRERIQSMVYESLVKREGAFF